MPKAKLTSKGQVTIPKSVRDALGVGPGDRLTFHVHQNGTVTLEAATIDWRALVGSVKSAVQGVTIEQMDEGIGEAVREEFERSVR